jgi:hypothetical protein
MAPPLYHHESGCLTLRDLRLLRNSGGLSCCVVRDDEVGGVLEFGSGAARCAQTREPRPTAGLAEDRALNEATEPGATDAPQTLFQSLHHDRRIAARRFAEEQVHVLGHDHVTNHDKAIAAADLLQHLEKEIAWILPATQQRASLITTGGDKVQVSGAVVTMESVSHAAELVRPFVCDL